MAKRKSSPDVDLSMPLTVDEPAAAPSQGVESTATPSESFSTTTTDPTCPTCGSSYPDMPISEFDNHVAGCTRPSTATTRESSSELTPPPQSPSLAMDTPAVALPANQPEVVTQETAAVLPEPVAASEDVEQHNPNYKHDFDEDLIRAYVDPKKEFVYYGEEEVADEAGSEPKVPALPSAQPQTLADQNKSRDSGFVITSSGPSPYDWLGGPLPLPPPKAKAPKPMPFPKLTPIEVFEEYLDNPRDMDYKTLYHRTSTIQGVLADLQAEYTKIDKELFNYETRQKAAAKEADDELKEKLERERIVENAAREAVSIIHRDAVKLAPREFAEWVVWFEQDFPGNPETIRHLQNLRNPVFMAAFNKKKNAIRPEPKQLVDVPMVPDKPTKEEIALEKRKRGKLMDPAKWDDMKQADVYGFEYSSHPRHVGAQPLPSGPRQSTRAKLSEKDAGNDGTREPARTRGLRNKAKRPYEADLSAGADSEEDRRPAKRVRKPKIFEDGEEANGHPRTNAPTRSGTPAVRTFPSGKRVGRPPSKLAKVQTAIRSESPDPLTNGDVNGLNGLQNGVESHGIGHLQETELHDAAQSLVNQTLTDFPVIAPPVKKKHAGGRPRKNPLPVPDTPVDDMAAKPAVVPKPRNRGGRPKKVPVPASTIKLEATQQDMNEVLQSTEQADGVQESSDSTSQRPKRKRTTTDSSQNQIIVDAAPVEVAPPAKKRKTRAPRGATEEQQRREPSTRVKRASTRALTEEPQRREPSTRRTRAPTRGLTEERDRRQSTVPPDVKGKGISVPKKRKAVGAQRFATAEPRDETGADADIDDIKEENGEVMKKKRATKAKAVQSVQEPRPIKARGSSSARTIVPQPIRKTSNAVKNAMAEMDREMAQAAATTPAPTPNQPLPPPYFNSAPPNPPTLPEAAEGSSSGSGKATVRPKSEPATRKPKAPQVPPPPPSRVSTRVRRPARHRGGMDGADDTDDEDDEGIEKQFASEYDHYQALTSPGGNHSLGKRVRKSLVDLSAFSYGTTDSDDVEDSFEEVEEDEIY